MSSRKTTYICTYSASCFNCPLNDCALPASKCVNTNVMEIDTNRTYNNEWRDKE